MISHRGAKQKFLEYLPRSFPLPIMFKKYRYYIKRVVTLAKIQNTKEVSHYLTLMYNGQTF